MKKNLILSIVHNYDYQVIEPFIKSLKESGYEDDLVIFCSNSTKKTTKKLLQSNGAITVPFDTDYPFRKDYKEVFQDISHEITINNYRFPLFLQFLQLNAESYGQVMLTDIRDVIFQENIFDRIQNDQIYFFLEDQSEIFRTSQMNRGWLLQANGSIMTEELLDKNVSCAGITIGCLTLVVNYLQYLHCRLKFREDLVWGVDQGLHNAYVHQVRKQSAIIIPNNRGLVLTLGACKSFHTDERGNLVNEAGVRYAVVHQWDRFGALIVFLKRKYIGNRAMQVIKKIAFAILP